MPIAITTLLKLLAFVSQKKKKKLLAFAFTGPRTDPFVRLRSLHHATVIPRTSSETNCSSRRKNKSSV
jgi:hypothetical protein